jgi:Glyoxalase/Bleomycin resistance protein/Dioxygenase superfamily
MSESVTGELGLPPIDQVSYVVKDVDRALERFEPLFGSFQVMEVTLEGTLYRGRPADVRLKLAFGRSGPIEIELIEVLSGESPHKEFLEAHGEGQHHVRCLVPDLDPVVERAQRHGFEAIWSHQMPRAGYRFVYLERDGIVLELLEGAAAPQTSLAANHASNS